MGNTSQKHEKTSKSSILAALKISLLAYFIFAFHHISPLFWLFFWWFWPLILSKKNEKMDQNVHFWRYIAKNQEKKPLLNKAFCGVFFDVSVFQNKKRVFFGFLAFLYFFSMFLPFISFFGVFLKKSVFFQKWTKISKSSIKPAWSATTPHFPKIAKNAKKEVTFEHFFAH